MAIIRPTIGNHTFVLLKGEVQGLQERLMTIERFGVDGTAHALLGQGGREYDLESTVDCLSASEVAATYAQYRASVGSTVSVKDELGTTHSNQRILGVERASGERARIIRGGIYTNSAYILVCRWRLVAV